MDSSYHVQTNVNIKRVIVQNTCVHSIHKREVLYFSSVYISHAMKNFIVKVDVQKEILRFREKLTLVVLFSSIIVKYEISCILYRP